MRRTSHAALSAFLMLGLVALVFQNASAAANIYQDDLVGSADDYLGNQLGPGFATPLVANGWDNSTNDTRMTYSEVAASAAYITPDFDTTETSPGLDIDGNVSTTSLKVDVATGGGGAIPGSAGHRFAVANTGATVFEFDAIFSNDTNSTDATFSWQLCRAAATAGTCDATSARMLVSTKIGNSTVPISVTLFNGVGFESFVFDDVNNTTTYENGDWIHYTMGTHTNASGTFFYGAVGDQWFQFQNTSMPDNTALGWSIVYVAAGNPAGGDWSYWLDNMYAYGDSTDPTATAEYVAGILRGNLTSQLNEITDMVTALLPAVVLIAFVPAIVRSMKNGLA